MQWTRSDVLDAIEQTSADRRRGENLEDSWFNWPKMPSVPPSAPGHSKRSRHAIGDPIADEWFEDEPSIH